MDTMNWIYDTRFHLLARLGAVKLSVNPFFGDYREHKDYPAIRDSLNRLQRVHDRLLAKLNKGLGI